MLKRFRSPGREIPLTARHVEASAVASLDDDLARPSERLLDVALTAVAAARTVSMELISERVTDEAGTWAKVWPGEHYKLLVGLIKATGARRVVEIGTFTGLSALAMAQALPEGGELVTFDIFGWDYFDNTALRAEDFEAGRLRQIVGDLTDQATFDEHAEILRAADLVFADAAKDGKQERIFLERFEQVGFTRSPIVVFDDIRVMNMLQIWRDITRPKLDLTSFGHWSGTGLVDYGEQIA